MVNLEIAQASLPVRFIVGTLAEQKYLVDHIYDGIDIHLTRSIATLQLLYGWFGNEGSFFTGIHASASRKRLGAKREEWPESKAELLFTLGMLHYTDSLHLIDKIAGNLHSPDMPVTLYPLENGEESAMVSSSNKFFQLKTEVISRLGLTSPDAINRFTDCHPEWSLIHDIQHSSLDFPVAWIPRIKKIRKGHLSLDRTDKESRDLLVPSNTLRKGAKDNVIYPWYMAMLEKDENMTITVEREPPVTADAQKWQSFNGEITGVLRRWAGK